MIITIFIYSKINKSENLRNLNGYNSKMGAISKEDIYDYISKIKSTLLNFNNSYTNKEYSNMKQDLNLFLIKSCNLYLLKLKNNIDLVSLKSATILTREANNKLKIKLYNQYNEIEYFIKNNSKNIESAVENYLYLLNYSSYLMELSYSIVYTRANEYFQLFSEIIQGKLKYLSDEEMKSYKYRILNGFPHFKPSFQNNMRSIARSLTNINNYLNLRLIDIKVDLAENTISIKVGKKELIKTKYKFEKNIGAEMNLDLIEKTFSASLSLCLGLSAKFKEVFKKKNL